MEQQAYFERGLEIIRRLNELTYEAYLVGGIVRDFLLQLPFNDIDIATSATPAQVIEAFPEATIENGKLGRVILKEPVGEFEITTFRIEEYDHPRKPSQIHYSTKLQEDIPRRDFTINGLAMSASQKIIDFCDGEHDLKHKIIKAIGKPKKRFKEDPLRILRAFSLIAHLNFRLDKKTKEAMIVTKKHLFEISEQQVSIEMIKIFKGEYGRNALKQMKKIDLYEYLPIYHLGLPIVCRYFNDLTLIEKLTICYKLLGFTPNNTSLDRKSLQTIDQLRQLSNKMLVEKVNPLLLYEHGLEMVLAADKINDFTYKKYRRQTKLIYKVQKQTHHIASNELAFRGQHLVELTGGERGPFIGEIIETLKHKIIMGQLPNNYEVLKKEAIYLLEGYRLKQTDKPEAKVENLKPEPTKTVEVTEEQKNMLFTKYRNSFNQLYYQKIDAISDFSSKTKQERDSLMMTIRKETHQELVKNYPEYKIFEV